MNAREIWQTVYSHYRTMRPPSISGGRVRVSGAVSMKGFLASDYHCMVMNLLARGDVDAGYMIARYERWLKETSIGADGFYARKDTDPLTSMKQFNQTTLQFMQDADDKQRFKAHTRAYIKTRLFRGTYCPLP